MIGRAFSEMWFNIAGINPESRIKAVDLAIQCPDFPGMGGSGGGLWDAGTDSGGEGSPAIIGASAAGSADGSSAAMLRVGMPRKRHAR